MITTKLIYIVMAILTIIPLVLFNLKKCTIKKEGEKPRLNITGILIVSLGGLFLGVFLFTLYRFTLNYQPQLVLERFVRSYSLTVAGKTKYEEFLKQTETVCTDRFNSQKNRCFSEIEKDKELEPQIIEFQLGESINPKYYIEQNFFPEVRGVEKDDTEPIYMVMMIDYGVERKFYFTLMHIDENKWYLDNFLGAPEELVEYAYRYKLIRPEHSNKWHKVKWK